MDAEAVRERLVAELLRAQQGGRSFKSISRDAGLGENYVQQFVNGSEFPSIETAMRLCETLKISFVSVVLGIPTTEEDEDALRAYLKLPQDRKALAQQMLRFAQPPRTPDKGRS